MTDPSLREICKEWEEWAASAPKGEAGWQEFFPRWPLLLDSAQKTMMSGVRDKVTLNLLEKCWAISEESEELAEFARDHIGECIDVVAQLADSELLDVRWQAYSVLSSAGDTGDAILRRSLDDPDLYCRRRAYLAIAEMRPADAFALAGRIINDEDPYMRLAAVELLRSCGDSKLIADAKAQLVVDRDPFVRQAAEDRLA